FFFDHPSTPELYTLSLHDALPISGSAAFASPVRTATPGWSTTGSRSDWCATTADLPYRRRRPVRNAPRQRVWSPAGLAWSGSRRSEEHTSELQSRSDLVCRLLLEK